MPIQSVLFDLDETLLDRNKSLRLFALWQAKGMLRREIENPEKFTERFINLDSNGSVVKSQVYSQLIEEFGISDWSETELTTSYELCFSGFCQPKEGARAAIKELKALGLRLGIVSNG